MEFMFIVAINAETHEKALEMYHTNIKDKKLSDVRTVLSFKSLQEIFDNDKKFKELQKVLKDIIK